MTDDAFRWYVLIPCSDTETWAVPQICLAEIFTLSTDTDNPPNEITWRDRVVPILDRGHDDGSTWREPGRGSGLVAIFLGLEGDGCEYWGVAVRGEGLTIAKVSPDEVQDAPEAVLQYASAAFTLNGRIYQVPDLDGLQKHIAFSQQVA
jgi:hypothetical protein